MMKLIKRLAAPMVVFMLSGAALATDYTDDNPKSWSEYADGEAVTIPAGKCYVVTEADVAKVLKLGLTIKGTLVLDNATSDFKIYAKSGSNGTIVKKGASRQTFLYGSSKDYGYSYNFTGTFRIEEGTAVHGGSYSFGDPQNSGNVYVCSGATAELATGNPFYLRAFHISGTGVNGNGALVFSETGVDVSKLILDDDALIVSTVAGNVIAPRQKPGSGRGATVDPATLNLNGHTLTFAGSSSRIGLNGCVVTDEPGTGSIVFAAAASGDRVVRFTGAQTALSAPVVFNGDTKVQFYDSCAPIDAPITANGSLTFEYLYSTPAGLTADYNNWRGDIAFTTPGSVLRFVPNAANKQITLSGSVSGDVSLEVGTSEAPASGVVRLEGHNTYTGGTVVYGTEDLVVQAVRTDSIPDTANMTVNGGVVSPIVSVEGGAYTFTPSAYLDYMAPQVAGTTGAGIPFEATAITNGEYTFTADLLAAKLSAAIHPFWKITGDGPGIVTYSGAFSEEDPLELTVFSGSARLTGEETINLTNTTVSGQSAGMGGTMLLENAKDVKLGHATITLGNLSSTTPKSTGTLIVSNSTLRTTVTPATDSLADAALWVGRYSQGILRIEGDSVVSNRVLVGGGNAESHSGNDYGVGAIYQRGGKLFPRRSPTSDTYYGSSIGVAGHGYYELTDGAYCEFLSTASFGYAGSCVVMQYDGTVKLNGGTLYLGNFNYNSNHDCTYYIRKGVFDAGANSCWLSFGAGNRTVLTLDGPEAKFRIGNSISINRKSNNTTVINLNNGGELEAWFLSQYLTREELTQDYPLVVNFNGGILKHGAARTYRNPFNSAKQPVNKVTIYEKGAVFDSFNASATGDDANLLTTRGANLDGATGNGVQSITLPEPLTDCIAAPRVIIECEGAYGATAVAEIDSRTATVTNILVTSHGWGYTPEGTTVKLKYGRYSNRFGTSSAYSVPSENIVIGPNTAGGITKIGVGELDVYGTNTWAQWTRVREGTMKAMTDRAIPSGTVLALANAATLDLNDVSEATFAGVEGTGGSVVNGTLRIVGDWQISARKFIERESTVIDGTVDLTDCTGIVLTDTEVLDEAAKKLSGLALFKATTVIGIDAVPVSGVPDGWNFSKTVNGFRLSVPKGSVLIIR